MKVVVALGGNALLRRGQTLSADGQQIAIRQAAHHLALVVAAGHHLTITHGNGPQVGLLALQSLAGPAVSALPLDVLDAESEGWIGYGIELELRNALPPGSEIVTVLTQIRVDPADPAFNSPTKPIGPLYDESVARRLAGENGWSVAADGAGWRRVVASPAPMEIVEIASIQRLIDAEVVVICAGGGGIPVAAGTNGRMDGVEAVIDKDATSCLLARLSGADLFVMLTDVDGVYTGFGTPGARMVRRAGPDALQQHLRDFGTGSMGPKVAAASAFARATGRPAAIGALADLAGVLDGTKGTTIAVEAQEIEFR